MTNNQKLEKKRIKNGLNESREEQILTLSFSNVVSLKLKKNHVVFRVCPPTHFNVILVVHKLPKIVWITYIDIKGTKKCIAVFYG